MSEEQSDVYERSESTEMMTVPNVICAKCSVASRKVNNLDTYVLDCTYVYNSLKKEFTFTARCHGEVDWCVIPKYLIDQEYGWHITEAVAFRDDMVMPDYDKLEVPAAALSNGVANEASLLKPGATAVTPQFPEIPLSLKREPDVLTEKASVIIPLGGSDEPPPVVEVVSRWAGLEGAVEAEPDGGVCMLDRCTS